MCVFFSILFVWVHCVCDGHDSTFIYWLEIYSWQYLQFSTVLIRTILICLTQKIVNYRSAYVQNEKQRDGWRHKSESTRMCDFITVIHIIVMLTNVTNRLSVSFFSLNPTLWICLLGNIDRFSNGKINTMLSIYVLKMQIKWLSRREAWESIFGGGCWCWMVCDRADRNEKKDFYCWVHAFHCGLSLSISIASQHELYTEFSF